MVMQGIQITQKVSQISAQHFQNAIVARLHAVVQKVSAECFQDIV